VDPLDSTKEFIQRNGQFTVNIALVRAGRPVLGVVHVPVQGVTYGGVAGAGAWKQDGIGERRPIQVRRLSGGPVRVVGSRSHRGPDLDGYLERLGEHEMVPMGSSLKFCIVAEGQADVYPRLGPTSEWDTAAAEAVLVAAGGRVVTSSGQPMAYNKGPDLLNPWFIASGDASRDWTEYLP
jgi:3'(2'), 5'-bisphosphate nucleotidase